MVIEFNIGWFQEYLAIFTALITLFLVNDNQPHNFTPFERVISSNAKWK